MIPKSNPFGPYFGHRHLPEIVMDDLCYCYNELWFNVQLFDPHVSLSILLECPDGSAHAFSARSAFDGTLGAPLSIPGHYITTAGQYTLSIQGPCRGADARVSKAFTALA